MNGWRDLKQQVIDRQCCCLCGTCLGICPVKALEYAEGEIRCVPDRCIECGRCIETCPGKSYDYLAQNQRLFGDFPNTYNPDFGHYLRIEKGYSKDSRIRANAASGGIATALGCYLLEMKAVDYVIGVTGGQDGYQVRALQTQEEVLSAMQSKYVFIPVNEIIRFILEHEGRYLYLALPCQIQGMRKAATRDPKLEKRIYLYVGLFCGFNMTGEATAYLIRKSGFTEIEKLEYRGSKDGKTGFKVTAKDREFFVSKHGYTVLNAFYSRERCWKCYDLTGEFTDLSLGDAWEMGSGWSRLIIRTSKASDIVREMEQAGWLTVEPSGETDLYSSQKKLIHYKKRSIQVRETYLRNFPDYNVDLPQVAGAERIKAMLFLLFLKFGKTGVAKKLLEWTPIRLLEKLSELARDGNLSQLLCYGFWGVVTSLVNVASYGFLLWNGLDYKVANLFAMILTKTTAYLSNKHFVFQSKCSSWSMLAKEIFRFAVTRGMSGVVEYIGLIGLVDILHMDKMLGKIAMLVIITGLNYYFGKYFVYQKK